MKKGYLLFLIFALTACNAAVKPAPTLPAVDTAAPTSTVIPSPTATLTPTPVPNGPCDNPLVPLTVGNQWTYRVTTDSGESLYTLKAVERQDAANIVVMVEFTDQKNNSTIREPVVCRDGAIRDFPLYVMDMLFRDYLDRFFNTYLNRGNYAPAYSSLTEKNWVMDWDTEYLAEEAASLKNPADNTSLYILRNNSITLSFQMDGSREPIAVPAGEFPQAMKVSQSFTVPVSLNLAIGGVGGVMSIHTTQWYEPYIGLLRAQVDIVTIEAGTQIDMPMKSIIELIEFKPANQ